MDRVVDLNFGAAAADPISATPNHSENQQSSDKPQGYHLIVEFYALVCPPVLSMTHSPRCSCGSEYAGKRDLDRSSVQNFGAAACCEAKRRGQDSGWGDVPVDKQPWI